MTIPGNAGDFPRVSVTVPVKNERGNIEPLVTEIEAAMAGIGAYEIVYVDDASTDDTLAVLQNLQKSRPHLRVISQDVSCGKSGALYTAIRFARAGIIATLDGDGQNNPAYLPAMIAILEQAPPEVALVQGERQRRQDSAFKRLQSRIANRVRSFVLADDTRDTGCGVTVVRRAAYLNMPYFQGLHRFTPALIKRQGHGIITHPVIDRPRLTGTSHYGFFNRLWVGLVDLVGVWWLIRRHGPHSRIREMPR